MGAGGSRRCNSPGTASSGTSRAVGDAYAQDVIEAGRGSLFFRAIVRRLRGCATCEAPRGRLGCRTRTGSGRGEKNAILLAGPGLGGTAWAGGRPAGRPRFRVSWPFAAPYCGCCPERRHLVRLAVIYPVPDSGAAVSGRAPDHGTSPAEVSIGRPRGGASSPPGAATLPPGAHPSAPARGPARDGFAWPGTWRMMRRASGQAGAGRAAPLGLGAGRALVAAAARFVPSLDHGADTVARLGRRAGRGRRSDAEREP